MYILAIGDFNSNFAFLEFMKSQYRVQHVIGLEGVVSYFEPPPDLITLSDTVCKAEEIISLISVMRRKTEIPIVIVPTKATDSGDIADMLDAGADDFLGNMSLREGFARIHAIIRRKAGYSSSVIKVLGRLYFDLNYGKIWVDENHKKRLSPRLNDLLHTLVLGGEKLVTTDKLMATLGCNSSNLAVHVCKLRRVIFAVDAEVMIENRHSRGYILLLKD